jgi:DNA topoisomerase-1
VALHERGSCDTVTATKKATREIIETVSGRLGNTPTICRKCYIHPEVLTAYGDATLALRVRQADAADKTKPSPEEAAVYRFLVGRLG